MNRQIPWGERCHFLHVEKLVVERSGALSDWLCALSEQPHALFDDIQTTCSFSVIACLNSFTACQKGLMPCLDSLVNLLGPSSPASVPTLNPSVHPTQLPSTPIPIKLLLAVCRKLPVPTIRLGSLARTLPQDMQLAVADAVAYDPPASGESSARLPRFNPPAGGSPHGTPAGDFADLNTEIRQNTCAAWWNDDFCC